MELKLTPLSNQIISLLKEDRLEEAIEYSLYLLKKEADEGSASKYFFKKYKNFKNIKINSDIESNEEIIENSKSKNIKIDIIEEEIIPKNDLIEESIKKIQMEKQEKNEISNIEEKKQNILDLSEF